MLAPHNFFFIFLFFYIIYKWKEKEIIESYEKWWYNQLLKEHQKRFGNDIPLIQIMDGQDTAPEEQSKQKTISTNNGVIELW